MKKNIFIAIILFLSPLYLIAELNLQCINLEKRESGISNLIIREDNKTLQFEKRLFDEDWNGNENFFESRSIGKCIIFTGDFLNPSCVRADGYHIKYNKKNGRTEIYRNLLSSPYHVNTRDNRVYLGLCIEY